MKKIVFFMILGWNLLLGFCSCSSQVLWFGEKEVELVLPDFLMEFEQESAPDFAGWHIWVCSKNGITDFRSRNKSERLKLNKNEIGSVLAYPVCLNSEGEELEFFKPAGALFYETNDNSLLLDWYGGLRAWFLKEILEKEMKTGCENETWVRAVESFNWNKLKQVQEKMIFEQDWDYIHNPWKMNLEAVLQAIACGSFKANLLNVTNVFEIEAPDEGKCYSEFVPENKNIKKNCKILIKQSEVNLISSYNLNAIIIVGKSAQEYSVKYCRLPVTMKGYD